VSTPLGQFIRARRDATAPESVGVPVGPRRRVPGLRRSELASLAGISVEYLVRIEQGRDHNPSVSVVNAVADALRLSPVEREHLRYLAKGTSATCVGGLPEPRADLRPAVRALLDQIEPGLALVTNRLGDVLASTRAFDLLARPTGLLDARPPNLTRFVFGDARARDVFPDWERVADERAWDLWLAQPAEQREQLVAELAVAAGYEVTARLHRRDPPAAGVERWHHPIAGELRFDREVLELPAGDGQQLVVLLPADATTAERLDGLRRAGARPLRAVT
jgi:transcriptional regulator with XRE-family HTH domain